MNPDYPLFKPVHLSEPSFVTMEPLAPPLPSVPPTVPPETLFRTVRRWSVWFALALALHFLFSEAIPLLIQSLPQTPTPPIQITSISPNELQSLKEKIKTEAQRKLLLSPLREDPENLKSDPPENARYDSDRNRAVKKETRAKNAVSSLPTPPGTSALPGTPVIPLSKLGLTKPSLGASPSRKSQAPTSGGNPNPLVLDDEVAEGSETLLNTRESKYYSFYARISAAISPIWESSAREVPQRLRLQAGDYRTQVLFELDQAGKLKRIAVLTSSGVEDFDRAATRAIERVAEFPNPPRDLLETDGRIRISLGFVFRLSHSGGVRWLPPQR